MISSLNFYFSNLPSLLYLTTLFSILPCKLKIIYFFRCFRIIIYMSYPVQCLNKDFPKWNTVFRISMSIYEEYIFLIIWIIKKFFILILIWGNPVYINLILYLSLSLSCMLFFPWFHQITNLFLFTLQFNISNIDALFFFFFRPSTWIVHPNGSLQFDTQMHVLLFLFL